MSNLWNSDPERYSQPEYARENERPQRSPAPRRVIARPVAALPDPILCPNCGMPDVREIVRYEGPVYYVDAYCPDCEWYEIDVEGGI